MKRLLFPVAVSALIGLVNVPTQVGVVSFLGEPALVGRDLSSVVYTQYVLGGDSGQIQRYSVSRADVERMSRSIHDNVFWKYQRDPEYGHVVATIAADASIIKAGRGVKNLESLGLKVLPLESTVKPVEVELRVSRFTKQELERTEKILEDTFNDDSATVTYGYSQWEDEFQVNCQDQPCTIPQTPAKTVPITDIVSSREFTHTFFPSIKKLSGYLGVPREALDSIYKPPYGFNGYFYTNKFDVDAGHSIVAITQDSQIMLSVDKQAALKTIGLEASFQPVDRGQVEVRISRYTKGQIDQSIEDILQFASTYKIAAGVSYNPIEDAIDIETELGLYNKDALPDTVVPVKIINSKISETYYNENTIPPLKGGATVRDGKQRCTSGIPVSGIISGASRYTTYVQGWNTIASKYNAVLMQ